ncbi:MAG: lycopene cyclase domain-containing protein [Thermoproteota archaeon]|nr:lycopene cyclase domain-containing protein [Thermoproteota archaeon]
MFDLAQKTGFDIESLIFCFAIGGIGSVLYQSLSGAKIKKMSTSVQCHSRHRWHYLALATPIIVFLPLLWFTPLNPIYPAIIAMFAGGIATQLCRPDLTRCVWLGGILFAFLYFVFFLTINVIYPQFLHEVWNMQALTGIHFWGVPLEEILFAFSFGMMWSSVYEHLLWYRQSNNVD